MTADQPRTMTPEERRAQSRRNIYMTLALNNPAGLTKYQYTKNMTKADALSFWTDAHALGFVKLGQNDRGTKLYGLRSVSGSLDEAVRDAKLDAGLDPDQQYAPAYFIDYLRPEWRQTFWSRQVDRAIANLTEDEPE